MYPLHVLLSYVLSAIMDLSCNLLNHALEAAASAYSVLYVPATKVIPSIRQISCMLMLAVDVPHELTF